jgi:DNA-binding NtrC family response regulator
MAKILLAEQDQDLRFILVQVLNAAGHDVEILNESPSIANDQSKPDVFILDQQTPSIDGLALAKYLGINTGAQNIPVIMISTYPEVKRKAKRLGVSEFLPKPFDAKDLLSSIDRHTNPMAIR